MNKYIFIALLLLVLIGGYFYTQSREGTPPMPSVSTSETVEETGTVTAVDLSQMALDGPAVVTFEAEDGTYTIAIPSMGINLCAARESIDDVSEVAVGDTVAVKGQRDSEGHIVPCENEVHFFNVTKQYTNEEIGFSFSYPAGYVLEENLSGFSEHPQFVHGLMLTDKQDQAAFQASTDAREGPPTIQVRVIRNTSMLSPSVWVEQNPSESNTALALNAPEEAVVGGANAVRYLVDGLYVMNTHVVAHGGYIFILLGNTLDESSAISQAYGEIVDSFSFIPTPEQAAESL